MSLRTPERQMSSAPRCDLPVQGDGIMSYHCSLPQGHAEHTNIPEDPQPCYAVESSRSARAWDAWKARQEEAQDAANRDVIDRAGGGPIECPGCGNRTLKIDPEESRATCTYCGVMAEFQSDQPEQSPSPESIEDIEQPGEPWRTLADPELGADQIEYRKPTKQREGDQRLPAGGDRPVQDWIIAQMQESKRVGVERYGQPLMTFDGRLNIRDLAEELRDAYVYISKLQMMAEADRETLVRVVREAFVAERRGWLVELAEDAEAWHDKTRQGPAAERLAEVAVDAVLDWVLVQRIGPDQVRPETGE